MGSATAGRPQDELLLNNTAFNTFKQLRMLNELAESRETLFNFPVAVAGGPLAGRYEGMTRVAGADNGADVPRVVGRAHAGGAEGEKHYIPTSDPARKQVTPSHHQCCNPGIFRV